MNKQELLIKAKELYDHSFKAWNVENQSDYFVAFHDGKTDGINLIIQLINQLEETNRMVDFDETNFRDWLAHNLMSAKFLLPSMRTVDLSGDELEDSLVEAVNENLNSVSEKVTIPQFIADWIELEKDTLADFDLETPERLLLIIGHKLHDDKADTKVFDWVFDRSNEATLFSVIKHGYVIQEPLYHIVLPKLSNELTAGYLVYNKEDKEYFLSDKPLVSNSKYTAEFTKSEVEAIDKGYLTFAVEATYDAS